MCWRQNREATVGVCGIAQKGKSKYLDELHSEISAVLTPVLDTLLNLVIPASAPTVKNNEKENIEYRSSILSHCHGATPAPTPLT
ncbi:hypothetical protein ABEB36_002217 [Hypothenemus hampei]|uniref:Uncharacterized protein n=1 Tax=Hypothenemus hampei TaxID=57062 RepID=A0ABD1F6L6_HYPHA